MVRWMARGIAIAAPAKLGMPKASRTPSGSASPLGQRGGRSARLRGSLDPSGCTIRASVPRARRGYTRPPWQPARSRWIARRRGAPRSRPSSRSSVRLAWRSRARGGGARGPLAFARRARRRARRGPRERRRALALRPLRERATPLFGPYLIASFREHHRDPGVDRAPRLPRAERRERAGRRPGPGVRARLRSPALPAPAGACAAVGGALARPPLDALTNEIHLQAHRARAGARSCASLQRLAPRAAARRRTPATTRGRTTAPTASRRAGATRSSTALGVFARLERLARPRDVTDASHGRRAFYESELQGFWALLVVPGALARVRARVRGRAGRRPASTRRRALRRRLRRSSSRCRRSSTRSPPGRSRARSPAAAADRALAPLRPARRLPRLPPRRVPRGRTRRPRPGAPRGGAPHADRPARRVLAAPTPSPRRSARSPARCSGWSTRRLPRDARSGCARRGRARASREPERRPRARATCARLPRATSRRSTTGSGRSRDVLILARPRVGVGAARRPEPALLRASSCRSCTRASSRASYAATSTLDPGVEVARGAPASRAARIADHAVRRVRAQVGVEERLRVGGQRRASPAAARSRRTSPGASASRIDVSISPAWCPAAAAATPAARRLREERRRRAPAPSAKTCTRERRSPRRASARRDAAQEPRRCRRGRRTRTTRSKPCAGERARRDRRAPRRASPRASESVPGKPRCSDAQPSGSAGSAHRLGHARAEALGERVGDPACRSRTGGAGRAARSSRGRARRGARAAPRASASSSGQDERARAAALGGARPAPPAGGASRRVERRDRARGPGQRAGSTPRASSGRAASELVQHAPRARAARRGPGGARQAHHAVARGLEHRLRAREERLRRAGASARASARSVAGAGEELLEAAVREVEEVPDRRQRDEQALEELARQGASSAPRGRRRRGSASAPGERVAGVPRAARAPRRRGGPDRGGERRSPASARPRRGRRRARARAPRASSMAARCPSSGPTTRTRSPPSRVDGQARADTPPAARSARGRRRALGVAVRRVRGRHEHDAGA